MEYNSTREPLLIKEYGRNVQKLIEYALATEDREKRNRIARAIVNIMGQMNPQIRESTDYKQKLWDHLYLISDFKLDVDSPYPMPEPKASESKREKISYKSNHIRYRMYGSNIQKMIEIAATYDEGPEKEAFTKAIANQLKKSYLNWNRESVTDVVIFDHLATLSNNRLKMSEDTRLRATTDLLTPPKKKPFQKNRSGQFHNNKNRKKKPPVL